MRVAGPPRRPPSNLEYYASPPMELRNLIEVHLDPERLAKDLDELGPPGRGWAVRQWTPADLYILWRACAHGFRPLSMDGLCPPGNEADVVYDAYRPTARFGKHVTIRFGRSPVAEGDPDRAPVVGYEEAAGFPALAGPTHALVVECPQGGELALDYAADVPPLPAGWPPARARSGPPGAGSASARVDVLRGVSSNVILARSGRRIRASQAPRPNGASAPRVSIAPFHRGEVVQWRDPWTVLVRREARPSP